MNDCGDELDQLPVLQHCLMRLWDRAGGASPERPRRVTRRTYDDIGRMTEALSRHADEILRQCAGKELAVEQTFRALSELDREGRAIRRALRFDKLLAETGVAESDLRAVLDKFRAPTCSFLVPPPSAAPTLAADDRVDIGHETLLRRWKQLAGESEIAPAANGRPAKGWLPAEQADGQHYRTLASLLDGEASGEMATLKDPEREKRWWDSLPRTAAWADRYGGNLAGVRKLIDDNIVAKQRQREAEQQAKRSRWIGWAATAAFAGLAVAVIGWQAFESNEQQQEASSIGAMHAAKELLDQFLDGFIKGNITEGGSRTLAELVGNFVSKVKGSSESPDAQKLWVQTLNVESDLSANFAESGKALDLARQAKKAAEVLAGDYPKDPEALQAKFESLLRVGDAILLQPGTTEAYDTAFQEYNDALAEARKLQQLDPGEKPIDDDAKIHLKLGDVYKNRAKQSLDDALREYRRVA